MASTETIKWVHLNDNIGFYLKCVPFVFSSWKSTEAPTVKYGSRFELIQWVITSCAYICVKCAFISAALYYDLTHETRMSKKIQVYFILIVHAMSLVLQVTVLMFHGRIYQMLTSFYGIQQAMVVFMLTFLTLVDFLGIDSTEKDGTEYLFKTILLIGCGVTFLVGPAYYTLILLEVHVFAIFKDASPILQAIVCMAGAFEIFTDWIYVNIFAFMALIYCAAIGRCMRLFATHPIKTRQLKNRITILYKGNHVFLNLIRRDTQVIVGTSLTIASIIMISSLFGLIGFYHEFSKFVIVAISGALFVTVIVVRTCLHLATNITTLSKQFIESFMRNNARCSRRDRKCFRSLRPLYIPAGFFNDIQNETFPFIMSEIVLLRVIDLLLAFREH